MKFMEKALRWYRLANNQIDGKRERLDNIRKVVVHKRGDMLYCLKVRILIENIEVQLNDKGDGKVRHNHLH